MEVRREVTTRTINTDPAAFLFMKIQQMIWLGTTLIEILLFTRLILMLLGAKTSGFVKFIYDLSAPLVQPFAGMFESPRLGESFLDSSTIVALVVWFIVGSIISWAVAVLSDRV